MRQILINHMPVPAFAAAGVCHVSLPAPRGRAAAPAVTSPLVARRSPAPQAQITSMILAGAEGGYLVTDTKPGNELGGFRGVPPRGRPD